MIQTLVRQNTMLKYLIFHTLLSNRDALLLNLQSHNEKNMLAGLCLQTGLNVMKERPPQTNAKTVNKLHILRKHTNMQLRQCRLTRMS